MVDLSGSYSMSRFDIEYRWTYSELSVARADAETLSPAHKEAAWVHFKILWKITSCQKLR